MGSNADGVKVAGQLLAAAVNARWPMYLRNAKQILRAGSFDERRYGFGGLMDLLRACQREGFIRLERDRRGGLRVFQGARPSQHHAQGRACAAAGRGERGRSTRAIRTDRGNGRSGHRGRYRAGCHRHQRREFGRDRRHDGGTSGKGYSEASPSADSKPAKGSGEAGRQRQSPVEPPEEDHGAGERPRRARAADFPRNSIHCLTSGA